MSEFEEFVRSQGFNGDFQRGGNGQYKSDLLHFMEKAFMHQQAKINLLEKELTETQDFLNNQNHIKQAKIDELQRKIVFQEKAIKNIKLQFENKQIDCDRSDRKIDELQARIDKTVNHIEEWYGCVELSNIVDMLKGNKDEN